VLNEDGEKLYELSKCLKEKYNTDNLDRIFAMRHEEGDKIQYEKEDREEYKRLKQSCDLGLRVSINSNVSNTKYLGHGGFTYFFENNNVKYWKLDSNEYYIVQLNGFGYTLRYFDDTDRAAMLNRCGVSSLSDLLDKNKRYEAIQKYFTTLKHVKDANKSMSMHIQDMMYSLITNIYNADSGIHLYECNAGGMAFAVERKVNLAYVLSIINETINELNMQKCFDNIDIVEALRKPWGVLMGDVTNPLKIDIKYLNRANDGNINVDGCDKVQVIEYLKTLRNDYTEEV
jgi:hypothetical protein